MDVTVIQKYLARNLVGTAINVEAAAVSGNYTLSIIDATLIQQKLAGMDVF